VAEGVALLRAERVADAEQRFTEAAAAAPNAEAHFYLGVLHERRKAFDPAAQEYRRAIALAPDMAEAHDRLGFTLGLQGRTEQAIASFERAVALRPDLVDAQYHLGVTYWLHRRPQEAQRPLEAVLRLQPRHAEAHYYLGLVERALGRLPSAVEHLQAATSRTRTSASRCGNRDGSTRRPPRSGARSSSRRTGSMRSTPSG
jgi:tetratricopeptide (TPR) repeat protein